MSTTATPERPNLPAGLEFAAPGPGTWTTDPVHDPRPSTLYKQELEPEPFVRGFSETMARYGALIGTMQPLEHSEKFVATN